MVARRRVLWQLLPAERTRHRFGALSWCVCVFHEQPVKAHQRCAIRQENGLGHTGAVVSPEMTPRTARLLALVLGGLAFVLAVLATVVRYLLGKPTDYGALVFALFLLFFVIVIARGRPGNDT